MKIAHGCAWAIRSLFSTRVIYVDTRVKTVHNRLGPQSHGRLKHNFNCDKI